MEVGLPRPQRNAFGENGSSRITYLEPSVDVVHRTQNYSLRQTSANSSIGPPEIFQVINIPSLLEVAGAAGRVDMRDES